jgi:putative transposase
MSAAQHYPSDLSAAAWERLAPLIPSPKPGGRPRAVEMRRVCDAIFYVDRTGCQWRYLPKEYPNWKTVYWYFVRWQDDGTWERITDAVRRQLRRRIGRDPEPSAAVLDSQSVKTTERGARAATTATRR